MVRRWLGVSATLVALGTCFAAGRMVAAKDDGGPPRIGRFIRVALPIDSESVNLARGAARRAMEMARKEHARLLLVFQFDAGKNEKEPGRGSDFGEAYQFANFLSGDELSEADNVVAYLPQSIEGHAVLPVMACREIIMAKDATIGSAGIDTAPIGPTIRSAYSEIAGRRRTVLAPVVLAMLDPAIELLQVRTEVGQEYVTPEGLAQLEKRHVTGKSVVLKRAGEEGLFSASEGRRMGFVSYLADSRRQVAEALGLPATAIADDPSLTGGWRPARVDLTVPISADAVDTVEQMVHEQINQGTNFICVWIDSPGGPVDQAMRLANYLASLDPSKVRTVAYIPDKALSDAAVVALSCDQVVVRRRAQLGGPGEYEPNAAEIEDMRSVISKEIAPRKGRSWSLTAALVDPRLTVYRVRRPPGETDYFCDAELAEQAGAERSGAAKWEKEGDPVKTPGKPLKLDGSQAEEYHLANQVVENFEEFGRYFGLKPEDIRKVEPGWADALIKAMASPGVALLLLFIGAAGLWVELHHPGTGVGAFVAVVCFLLFFWSHYLGGTAGWLQVTLFLAGTCCVLLEVFVLPGFGIFGLGGGAMILASIILASQTFILPRNDYQFDRLETSLLTVAGAAVGLIAFAVVVRHRLPRSRLFGHIMLEPPEGEEAEFISQHEALADFRGLLGARGTTTTLLMPSGKARFGDQLVDVIADGEMIDRGATIEIVEVRGSRVLVRQVG